MDLWTWQLRPLFSVQKNEVAVMSIVYENKFVLEVIFFKPCFKTFVNFSSSLLSLFLFQIKYDHIDQVCNHNHFSSSCCNSEFIMRTMSSFFVHILMRISDIWYNNVCSFFTGCSSAWKLLTNGCYNNFQ